MLRNIASKTPDILCLGAGLGIPTAQPMLKQEKSLRDDHNVEARNRDVTISQLVLQRGSADRRYEDINITASTPHDLRTAG